MDIHVQLCNYYMYMYLCESVQLAFVYTGASESVRECDESGREKKRK